ncbi:MAG TPA: YkgJ family cysteine cluster protein [Thermoplasmata archaeon]
MRELPAESEPPTDGGGHPLAPTSAISGSPPEGAVNGPRSRDPRGPPRGLAPTPSAGWEIDCGLIDAFSFRCRPDCGLCCFATPSVTPPERERLLQILPELSWESDPHAIPARPDGGACQYLADVRCRVHVDRPFPCAEFPVSVHLGPRAQASVVLSCPGLSLEPLESWVDAPRSATGLGLENEVATVRGEMGRVPEPERRRIEREWARAARRAGFPPDSAGLDRLRSEVRSAFPSPSLANVLESPLPEESEGLETLPLFFDPTYGRVALAGAGEEVDLLSIREGGGVERRIASFGWPERLPRCVGPAARLLRGYLEYVLDRDALFGAVMVGGALGTAEGAVGAVRRDLTEIGGTVLARSYWRAQLAGGLGESLSIHEVAAGIRATDADYLDRPTAGRWL